MAVEEEVQSVVEQQAPALMEEPSVPAWAAVEPASPAGAQQWA